MTTLVGLIRRGESEPRLVNPSKPNRRGEITFNGGSLIGVIDTNGTMAARLGTEQTRVNFPANWDYSVVSENPGGVLELPGNRKEQKVLLIQTEAEVKFNVPLSASARWEEMVVIRK